MKVYLTSENPVKLRTVETAFNKMFPDESVEIIGKDTQPDIGDQPIGEIQTLQAASNRIKKIIKQVEADFYVAFEGGVKWEGESMLAFAFVVVTDGTMTSKSRTADFTIPKKVAQLVKEGYELGDADDKVFGRTNSKQKEGAVGLLTDGLLTREDLYYQSMVITLIPFRKRGLYE